MGSWTSFEHELSKETVEHHISLLLSDALISRHQYSISFTYVKINEQIDD